MGFAAGWVWFLVTRLVHYFVIVLNVESGNPVLVSNLSFYAQILFTSGCLVAYQPSCFTKVKLNILPSLAACK